jgi:Tubulin-tyrosine ligase family
LLPQIKDLIIKSMAAVRKKLDPYRRKFSFEMFGYDFILDEDFNVWLIEVNTNPCIEESSNLLKMLIPRMIEDMLRITVDRAFPRIKKGAKAGTVKKPSNTTTSVVASPAKNFKSPVKHSQ